ncbi:M48 family metallopeptidase [Thalassolituus sp. LLYu03]|uniref:M48 family metallopeptidase n=1 Tax=Thalassolituus sp. LLYu03 TaxID=3421656 RepID=UPI003D286772
MKSRKSYRKEMWLTLAGEQVALHVSAMRRKSMRLQMTDEGIIDLRIPIGCPQTEVLAFVNRHEAWLLERRHELRTREQRKRSALMVRGRELPVMESALGQFMVADNVIWVPAAWTPEQTDKALDGWLREQARSEYQRMIERWWPAFEPFGVSRPQLRIKKMRTRWGSLSTRGYINLNLSLMQLPEAMLELVVVHELCHLRDFDHGPGFRRAMSECLPDWRAREAELKTLARYL